MLHAAPPVATRLNRVALGIIVVLVAVTAIVAVHYVATSGGPAAIAGRDSVIGTFVPQRPSFPVPAPAPVPTRGLAPAPVPTPVPVSVMHITSPVARRRSRRPSVNFVIDSSPSPVYVLAAGTVLPAALVTEINSDLPGTVVAQVSRDVYDSRTGAHLLVPRGTKLIGRYDSHLSVGQRRLLVTWTRLVAPDGRELALPDVASIDAHGAAGLSDVTDNHVPRVFGTALLLSAISAGAQLSQPTSGNALTSPSAGQVAAGALGQQMSGTGLDLVRRDADIPPTITARAGLAFDLILARDLVLPFTYDAARHDDGRR
jgi:type IV secretory pathway VirB10-like protein